MISCLQDNSDWSCNGGITFSGSRLPRRTLCALRAAQLQRNQGYLLRRALDSGRDSQQSAFAVFLCGIYRFFVFLEPSMINSCWSSRAGSRQVTRHWGCANSSNRLVDMHIPTEGQRQQQQWERWPASGVAESPCTPTPGRGFGWELANLGEKPRHE